MKHSTPAAILGWGTTLLIIATKVYSAEATITTDELVRYTQQLVDAVAIGDRAPWIKYFASNCMYFDEKGRKMDKDALITDLRPLPVGFSGSIKVGNPQSLIFGDTAILSYDLDETELVFGQTLTARYHATDTWRYRNGLWQIAAGQIFRYYEDPSPGPMDRETYRDYVGDYELHSTKKLTVIVVDHDLFVQRSDGTRTLLISEVNDLFFCKGVEGRYLFRRGPSGTVEALVQRRNNEDIVWKKASP